jgi:hypothetical protein
MKIESLIERIENHPFKPYYVLWSSIDLIHGERNIIGDTKEEVIEKFKKIPKKNLSPEFKKYA